MATGEPFWNSLSLLAMDYGRVLGGEVGLMFCLLRGARLLSYVIREQLCPTMVFYYKGTSIFWKSMEVYGTLQKLCESLLLQSLAPQDRGGGFGGITGRWGRARGNSHR